MNKILPKAILFSLMLITSVGVNAQYVTSKFIAPVNLIVKLQKGSYVENEILVKFRKNITNQAVSNMSASFGHEISPVNSLSSLNRVKFSTLEKIEDVLAIYQSDPNVLYAQVNLIYKIAAKPTDNQYTTQWSLNNSVSPTSDIDAETAWDIHNDCSANNTIVAVVDTGINYLHVDLKNNMWINTAESTNGRDTDGNGKIDDINGWDFSDGDNSPLDFNGHGTHIAGTIGAGVNNDGTVGVCWKASIMAVRVGDAAGGGITSARLVQGIDYAIMNGANIINLSLGSPHSAPAERDIVTKARDNGVILVVAAGNESANNDDVATPSYPCNYKYASYAGKENQADVLDNIICVASVDRNYAMSEFSNFGTVNVDVGAPGTDINSTWAVTSTDIVNQGLLSVNNTPMLGWSSDPIANKWQFSKQQIFSNALDVDVLSDPSGFNTDYSPDIRHTLYQTFDFPVADAFVLNVIESFDIANPSDVNAINEGSDHTSLVFGAGNAVPTSDLNFIFGKGLGIISGEIPANFFCSGAPCTVGVKLTSNGNLSVGKGVDILWIQVEAITQNNSAYNTISGTSMSTPHVVGLAALIKSYNPDYRYKDVVQSVLNGGDNIPALANRSVTGKAINAYGSLTYINKPTGLTATFVRN